jgi:Phytanoyl-CoA dioxygenase (PhyH)
MLERLEEEILRDGFLMLRGFFPAAEAGRARNEMAQWFELDLQERAAVGANRQSSAAWHHFEGAAGNSDLSRYAHGLSNGWGKSPTLDQMMLKLVMDPVLGKLLIRLAGHDYRLLTLFCRRMTGERDKQQHGLPGQRWHRDGRGGATIGILLADIPERDSGSTKMIRGSHRFPYDPQLSCLFSQDGSLVHPAIRSLRIANRVLESRLRSRVYGACGQCGDVYLFTSETWHGRQANLTGSQAMIALVGIACASVTAPNDLPSSEVLLRLPPEIVGRLLQPYAVQAGQEPLLDQIVAQQTKLHRSSLFNFALAERVIGEILEKKGFIGLAKQVGQRLRS